MSTSTLKYLKVPISLHGTTERAIVSLRSGSTVYQLKERILEQTEWFGGLTPSRLIVYRENSEAEGKVDSPSLLVDDNESYIVRETPGVSEDRGSATLPWIRPRIGATTFTFITPPCRIVCLDTSVVKAVLLQEVRTLPVPQDVVYIFGKKVLDEIRGDPRAQGLRLPSYIHDLSHLIKGFTPDRQTLIFKLIYRTVYQNRSVDGRLYPTYEEFVDTPEYVNTCNDLLVYVESLVLCRFIAHAGNGEKNLFSFVTLDPGQAFLMRKVRDTAIDDLRLLLQDGDRDRVAIRGCRHGELGSLFP